MKRKFSLVMSAAMILSLIAPMTNALAEDIQTPETATPETVVTEDAARRNHLLCRFYNR